MKEPHRKGVANHPDPESCAGGGNIAGEALTGAHAGQLSSSEITSIGVPTLCDVGEGHTKGHVQRELPFDAAESETLSMCGNSVRGNRETLEASSPNGGEERSAKASCRTADMHATRESAGPIVPEKRANKAGRTMLRMVPAAAELVEGRGSTKGNDMQALLAADTVPRKAGHRQAWRTSGLWAACHT